MIDATNIAPAYYNWFPVGNFGGDDQVTGWLWRSVALEAIGNFGGDAQVTGWLWR